MNGFLNLNLVCEGLNWGEPLTSVRRKVETVLVLESNQDCFGRRVTTLARNFCELIYFEAMYNAEA